MDALRVQCFVCWIVCFHWSNDHQPPLSIYSWRRGRLVATAALVFFHRFYSRNSFAHHDRFVRAFLGGLSIYVYHHHERACPISLAGLTSQANPCTHHMPPIFFPYRFTHRSQHPTLPPFKNQTVHGRRRRPVGGQNRRTRPQAPGGGAALLDAARRFRCGEPQGRGENLL